MKYVKNYIPFLGMPGFNGVQYLEHFCSKGRHPYIVRKSDKYLDTGELTFHAENTTC